MTHFSVYDRKRLRGEKKKLKDDADDAADDDDNDADAADDDDGDGDGHDDDNGVDSFSACFHPLSAPVRLTHTSRSWPSVNSYQSILAFC